MRGAVCNCNAPERAQTDLVKTEPNIPLTVRLPREMHAELTAIADKTKIGVGDLVRIACERLARDVETTGQLTLPVKDDPDRRPLRAGTRDRVSRPAVA